MDFALGFIMALIVYFSAHYLYQIWKRRPRPQFGDANGIVEVERGWPDESALPVHQSALQGTIPAHGTLSASSARPTTAPSKAYEIAECYQHHDWTLREDGYWCPTCNILRQPKEGVKEAEWRRGLHND